MDGDSLPKPCSQDLLCAKYCLGVGDLAVSRDEDLPSRVLNLTGDNHKPNSRLLADYEREMPAGVLGKRTGNTVSEGLPEFESKWK